MPITNLDWRGILVPALVAAQALMVHALASVEHPPSPPIATRFPSSFGSWRLFLQDQIDPAIAGELNADLLVSRTYVENPSGSIASVLVAWFQTQRGGVRQPHSPKVCLPGAGWTPQVVDEVTVATPAGTVAVNRYIVENGKRRAVVLYWYQTHRRVIAGEWAAKFWLAADALRDRRTDTALVRIITWSTRGGDEAATAVASGFARGLYPSLRAYLPQ